MDSDGSHINWLIVICIALVAVRAFYTCCELACTQISDGKVKSYEHEKGSKGLLFKLLSKPNELLGAFSAHRIFNAVMLALSAQLAFFSQLSQWADKLFKFADFRFAQAVAFVILIFFTALVLETFGDSLPKRLLRNTDKFAVNCAGFVKLMCAVLYPITAFGGLISRGAAFLLGLSNDDSSGSVTEEEIRLMVDAGNETGSIESSEREMINNVFEFHELTVSDVMTHRTDIVAVDIDAEISAVVYTAINSGFSRIPVYRESIDHIEGMIYVKDLLCLVGTQTAEGVTVKKFLRDAEYVPESCLCGELFKKFTANKQQLAVAVDEYGGTAGLVTMEDLVESIVGNIQDEYDNEAEEMTKISDDTYTLSGTADPSDIMEELGSPLPDDSEYDTMSGFITDLLGRIPEDNETPSVSYNNITFTVLLAEDMRIVRIKAVIKKDKEKELSNDEDNKEQKN